MIDELLAHRGAYWRLYNAQFDAPADLSDDTADAVLVEREDVLTEPVAIASPGALPPLSPVPAGTDGADSGGAPDEGRRGAGR